MGVGASPEHLQKLTYIALHHHPDVQLIDTVRCVLLSARTVDGCVSVFVDGWVIGGQVDGLGAGGWWSAWVGK